MLLHEVSVANRCDGRHCTPLRQDLQLLPLVRLVPQLMRGAAHPVQPQHAVARDLRDRESRAVDRAGDDALRHATALANDHVAECVNGDPATRRCLERLHQVRRGARFLARRRIEGDPGRERALRAGSWLCAQPTRHGKEGRRDDGMGMEVA